MRVARGKVVGSTVVVEGEPLPEGSHVTVWADDEEGFELDAESLDELAERQMRPSSAAKDSAQSSFLSDWRGCDRREIHRLAASRRGYRGGREVVDGESPRITAVT
ncbi:MAG: hypothetical protein ACOZIN_01220 [Myxococcota bacterium]